MRPYAAGITIFFAGAVFGFGAKGTVEGHVTDQSGHPLPDEVISVGWCHTDSGVFVLPIITKDVIGFVRIETQPGEVCDYRKSKTDREGNYRLGGIPEGSNAVLVHDSITRQMKSEMSRRHATQIMMRERAGAVVEVRAHEKVRQDFVLSSGATQPTYYP